LSLKAVEKEREKRGRGGKFDRKVGKEGRTRRAEKI